MKIATVQLKRWKVFSRSVELRVLWELLNQVTFRCGESFFENIAAHEIRILSKKKEKERNYNWIKN